MTNVTQRRRKCQEHPLAALPGGGCLECQVLAQLSPNEFLTRKGREHLHTIAAVLRMEKRAQKGIARRRFRERKWFFLTLVALVAVVYDVLFLVDHLP